MRMYEKRRNNNFHRSSYHSYPRPPFDVYMVEDYFPKVLNEIDSAMTQAILKRNGDLTPTPEEQTNLVNLVSKTQMVLERLALCPGNFDACQIEEVRCVGSFKKGTMLIGKNLADIVIILKTPPLLEKVKCLEEKIVLELSEMESSVTINSETTDGGFNIINKLNGSTVCCLITTIPPLMRKNDPTIHIPVKLLQRHMSAIRHIRWFEESANLTTVKVLIRVLRDICCRFNGLSALTAWMVDVLAHYSVTFRYPQQQLPLNSAFKRVFQLLAGGVFLPGSTGIPDPCENNTSSLHAGLTLLQQDQICMTAQTILRVMCYGEGFKVVLGLQPDDCGIATNMSVWESVVVAPSNPVFEVPVKEVEVEAEAETEMIEIPVDIKSKPISPQPT